jgi:hypothetical protein
LALLRPHSVPPTRAVRKRQKVRIIDQTSYYRVPAGGWRRLAANVPGKPE